MSGKFDALAAIYKAIGVDSEKVSEVAAAAEARRKGGPPSAAGDAGATPPAGLFVPPSLPPGVLGFVMGGYGLGETPSERMMALSQLIPYLPRDSLRVLPGVGAPWEVIDSVCLGVDVFDADYPGLLAHYGYAVGFITEGGDETVAPLGDSGFEGWVDSATSNTSVPDPAAVCGMDNGEDGSALGDGARVGGGIQDPSELRGPSSSSRKGFSGKYPVEGQETGGSRTFNAVRGKAAAALDGTKLYIGGKKYAEDWRPLMEGCSCFACSGVGALEGGLTGGRLTQGSDGRAITHPGHHRAYISHLFTTKEILGTMLLTIHNTHRYAALFSGLRLAILEGRLEAYAGWLKRANKWPS